MATNEKDLVNEVALEMQLEMIDDLFGQLKECKSQLNEACKEAVEWHGKYEGVVQENKVLRKGLGRIKREYKNWSKEDAPYALSRMADGYLTEATKITKGRSDSTAPDTAWCGQCNQPMTHIGPSKWQCDNAECEGNQ